MKSSKKDFSINKEILSNLSNIDNLVIKLNSNLNNPKLSNQVVFRAIYKILEKDIKAALRIILNYECNLENKSYLALIIKIYSVNNMIDEAMDIYNRIPDDQKKKRFIIVIYNQLVKIDKDKAFNLLFNRIYKNYVLIEDDIKKIYDKKYFEEIMMMLSDNEIVINDITFFEKLGTTTTLSNNHCNKCKNKIKKFELSDIDKFNLKSNILSKYITNISNPYIEKLDSFLQENYFNMFIDGNNLLFFKDREVNIDSFRRLSIIYDLVKDNFNPLFFIHIRHKKFINKLGIFKDEANYIINQLPIYWTPYKMNDDWFFIWSGLSVSNSFVLTNDLLRDHVYKISEDNLISNTLTVWKENSIIKYELIDGIYNIMYPLDYSIKVQNNKGKWHIPIIRNQWICI
jgi:hypothetical protein